MGGCLLTFCATKRESTESHIHCKLSGSHARSRYMDSIKWWSAHQQACAQAGFEQQAFNEDLVVRLRLVPRQRPQPRVELPLVRRSPPLRSLITHRASVTFSTL